MSDRADRIRRLLADHGGALARGSAVPPSEPAPTEPGPTAIEPVATQPTPDRLALLARLRALHVETTGTGSRPGLASLPPAPSLDDVCAGLDDDDRSLWERLGAERRVTPRGVVGVVERRFPLASPHGHRSLADAFARPVPLRARERRPGGRHAIDPSEAVFLDLETTGLSGGTGTLAFLVGLARRDGDDLVVKQWFVPDFPDEAAVLDAVADDLRDAPIVTFNGRTFDAPLLATRFRLHRIPFAERDHLDLLPAARRLWAGSLASHALQALEREVLGVTRAHDLPGALVPAAYFAWLREGRAAPLAQAFLHNEVDLLSLAALAGVVGRILADPTARPGAPAADHVATAHLLLDVGAPDRARACLRAAAATAGDAPAALRRRLGALARRHGDLPAALATWTAWIEAMATRGPFDPHPYEETAKHHEHRARDLPAALVVVEAALARCPADHARRGALLHRRARLLRRMGRTMDPMDPMDPMDATTS